MRFSLALAGILLLTSCAARQLRPDLSLSGQTSLVGCLNAGATPGEFVLTDRADARHKTPLVGPGMELHANHAVRVIGMLDRETSGHGLRVISIEHLAASCQAPF